MVVWACGCNTNGQVMCGGPAILCCPTPISCLAGISEVNIALSHILWKTKEGWKWTGYISGLPGEENFRLDWKYFISENSIAAINSDGDAVKWDSGSWRTVYFQTEDDGETVTEDADEVKTSRSDGETKHDAEASEKTQLLRYKNTEQEEMITKKIKLRHNVQAMTGQCSSAGSPSVCGPQEDTCDPPNSKPSFARLSVEDNVLLALEKDGTVYSGNVPVSVAVKISEVDVGKEHNIAVAANGTVFTWGSGMRGQLGIGELCQSEKPVTVESLQGINIIAVGCGAWHSYALSDSGEVYVWGWNESGQLGFPAKSENSHSVFNFLKHTCQCPNSAVSHSQGPGITKEKSTDVQCCNSNGKNTKENEFNLVPRKKDENVREQTSSATVDSRKNVDWSKEEINVQASPKLLDFWSEAVCVAAVSCGDRHTVFQLDDGSVWSAGLNKYGQLGLGHTNSVAAPTQVPITEVIKLYAGGWSSVFITSPGN